MKALSSHLPQNLKSLFWSYDFDRLDTQTHKRLIILQVLNYGSLEQLKWLKAVYGEDEIRYFLETTPVTEFRPQALRLVSLIFAVKSFSYAPRGSH